MYGTLHKIGNEIVVRACTSLLSAIGCKLLALALQTARLGFTNNRQLEHINQVKPRYAIFYTKAKPS